MSAPDDIPRHLRIALVNATRAFERDDFAALATINMDLQRLVDAAMACRARAIAAAEERGFERGQRKERAAVAAWLEAAGNYIGAFEIEQRPQGAPMSHGPPVDPLRRVMLAIVAADPEEADAAFAALSPEDLDLWARYDRMLLASARYVRPQREAPHD